MPFCSHWWYAHNCGSHALHAAMSVDEVKIGMGHDGRHRPVDATAPAESITRKSAQVDSWRILWQSGRTV